MKWSTVCAPANTLYNELEIYTFKLLQHLPRTNKFIYFIIFMYLQHDPCCKEDSPEIRECTTKLFSITIIVSTHFVATHEIMFAIYIIFQHCDISGILMGLYKKDVTPLLMHWSYIFLARTHWFDILPYGKEGSTYLTQSIHWPLLAWWHQEPGYRED